MFTKIIDVILQMIWKSLKLGRETFWATQLSWGHIANRGQNQVEIKALLTLDLLIG